MGPYGLFLVSGLSVGVLYALGGVGLVVLNRATGVLNFAYGAIGAMGAMAGWQLMALGYAEPFAWLASILIGLVLSLGFGAVVGPGLAAREPIVKAMATLGFALCLLGAMNLLWVVTPRKLALAFDKTSFDVIGMRATGTRVLALASGLIMSVGTALFLAHTRVGLMMRTVAVDREIASILGTPIRRVEMLAWGLSGAFAGFTGLLFADLVRLDPVVLTFLVIPIIATTIVGRLQSIPITFAAGLFIGVAESMLTLVKPVAPFRAAAPFIIAVLALMWLQRGRNLTFAGGE